MSFVPILTVNNNVSFLDINAKFNKYSSYLLVAQKAAIHNHIGNVLLTPIGAEPWEPTFGCNWEYELFNNVTDTSGLTIATKITSCVRRWLGISNGGYMLTGQVSVVANYGLGIYEITMPYQVPLLSLNGNYAASLGSPNVSSVVTN